MLEPSAPTTSGSGEVQGARGGKKRSRCLRRKCTYHSQSVDRTRPDLRPDLRPDPRPDPICACTLDRRLVFLRSVKTGSQTGPRTGPQTGPQTGPHLPKCMHPWDHRDGLKSTALLFLSVLKLASHLDILVAGGVLGVLDKLPDLGELV